MGNIRQGMAQAKVGIIFVMGKHGLIKIPLMQHQDVWWQLKIFSFPPGQREAAAGVFQVVFKAYRQG